MKLVTWEENSSMYYLEEIYNCRNIVSDPQPSNQTSPLYSIHILVLDQIVAQPKIIHDHVKSIIFDRWRIPLEMLLNLD